MGEKEFYCLGKVKNVYKSVIFLAKTQSKKITIRIE